jgi:hypothetical protein
MPKNAEHFYCKLCDFTTSKNSNWNKHLITRKHQLLTNVDKKFICDCGKQFTARQSLSRHRKSCNYEQQDETLTTTNNEPVLSNMITPEVVMKLLSQNQEFKEIIIEQQRENQRQQEENQRQQEENQKLHHKILETENKLLEAVKEGRNVTNNNCTTNNNKFNLNFFLNEQCKNAMNISDFIDSMVLSVEDLKTTGKLGYIGGITKIFTEKLKELDTYDRPMHCTDLKRETLYIKNNDEWGKDTQDKTKIKRAIECIANKNLNNLNTWKEENPNHIIMDSKEDKEYVEIMTNSLGGAGTDREKNKQKIIKNVLKEVMIDK